MLKTLPQSDLEYKEILRTHWNLDIDNNELIGIYSLSKTGSAGFFSNCTSVGGRRLKYPEDKYPLSIMAPENLKEEMVVGERYRFKVHFAALHRRLKLHPYLLAIVTDTVSLIGNTASVRPSVQPQVARDLSEVIREIYKEKLDQNYPNNVIDIAEAVEALAIDIYSENKRFIYELIQNADDAAIEFGSELVIEIKDGFVILSHNGKPFDEKDLRGLCGIGRGTKRDDETKTGYKGIGFKSVFGQKDGLVFVKSKDLLFRFDKSYMLANGWNRRWGIQSVWERSNSSKFKSPWQLIPILSESSNQSEVDAILKNEHFTVKTAIKVENETELAKDINELFGDARFLLFLRKIHVVTFRHQSNNVIIKKEPHAHKGNMFSLLKNDNVISSWYLKTMAKHIPADIRQGLREDSKSPKKLQEMDRAELSFAFLLGNDLNSIQALKKEYSCIFTYLPTTVKEFEFPFLVNANFLVDAGREKIHKDRIWNQWLFEVAGLELLNCCAEFASNDDLSNSFLTPLVSDYFPTGNKLMEWFNKGLTKAFKQEKFIPNKKGDLVLLCEIIIDKVNLIGHDVTDLDSISAYINANLGEGLVVNDNILPPFADCDKLLNFGAKAFTDKDLKLFFQSNFFLPTHQVSQNFNLLIFLRELDRGSVNGEWNFIIRNNTYIFSDNESLEKIPLVCFPLKVYKTDFGAEMTLIHSEVFELISCNPDMLAWLKSFDVKEPSEIAYLEKEIIGKIDTAINEENFIEVTEFILNLHLEKKLAKNHYNLLQDLPLKTSGKFFKAKDTFLHKAYNPSINFSEYLNGLNVLSEAYIGNYNANEWKSFFSVINVADDIRIIENYHITTNDINSSYLSDVLIYAKSGHSYPHLVNKTSPSGGAVSMFINYFTFYNNTTQLKYSEVFWNRIVYLYTPSMVGSQTVKQPYGSERNQLTYKLNTTRINSLDSMGWGYYPTNRTYIPSYIFWHLKNKACIPTNQDNCLLPEQVYTNSQRVKDLGGKYIPIIKVDQELSKEWVQFIGLRAKLSLSAYLEILTSVVKDTTVNGQVKYENIERIGLVYNELIELVEDFGAEEEQVIKVWAFANKFVCSDRIARKTLDCVWLRIPGFEGSSDKLNSFLVPKNVVADERAEKLFSLFSIRTVDNCDFNTLEQQLEETLTLKVWECLPAISLLLKSKMKVKSEESYLNNVVKKLDLFQFFSCKEILLSLNYKGDEIQGTSVPYYNSVEGFYVTKKWSNPLERYNISQYLAVILNCQSLEREIQLLLELKENDVPEYLESVDLSISTIEDLPIFEVIRSRINVLRHKLSGISILIKSSQSSTLGEINVSVKPVVIDLPLPVRENLLSQAEMQELKSLLDGSLSDDQMFDENLAAHVKALFYFENSGCDVSQARLSFKENLSSKTLGPIIDSNGQKFTVMCRSARSGLLFLGAYAWLQLRKNEIKLYILTGSSFTDCKICENTEDLDDANSIFWVIRREADQNYSNLESILKSDSEVKKMQLIYRMDTGQYKSIFETFGSDSSAVRTGGVIDDEI